MDTKLIKLFFYRKKYAEIAHLNLDPDIFCKLTKTGNPGTKSFENKIF